MLVTTRVSLSTYTRQKKTVNRIEAYRVSNFKASHETFFFCTYKFQSHNFLPAKQSRQEVIKDRRIVCATLVSTARKKAPQNISQCRINLRLRVFVRRTGI